MFNCWWCLAWNKIFFCEDTWIDWINPCHQKQCPDEFRSDRSFSDVCILLDDIIAIHFNTSIKTYIAVILPPTSNRRENHNIQWLQFMCCFGWKTRWKTKDSDITIWIGVYLLFYLHTFMQIVSIKDEEYRNFRIDQLWVCTWHKIVLSPLNSKFIVSPTCWRHPNTRSISWSDNIRFWQFTLRYCLLVSFVSQAWAPLIE